MANSEKSQKMCSVVAHGLSKFPVALRRPMNSSLKRVELIGSYAYTVESVEP